MKLRLGHLSLALFSAATFVFSQNPASGQSGPGDQTQSASPGAGEIRRAGLGKVDKMLLRSSIIPELAMPDAVPADDGGIDIATARAAALNRAHRLWGGSPTVESIVPVFDVVGKLVAYDVDLALQPGPWSYAQVATEWQGVLKENDRKKPFSKGTKDSDKLPSPSAPSHRFGNVTISANFDSYPVQQAGRGVSNYYASAWVAQHVAAEALHSPAPRLVAVHMLGPWERAYRFEANGEQILVEGQEPWGWYHYDTFLASTRTVTVARRNEVENMISARGLAPQATLDRVRSDNHAALAQVLSESNAPLSEHYISGYDSWFERLEWHYGCSPTAAAMVLNYWENRDFYGLLNTHFFTERDTVEHDTDCHVASLQLPLKLAMGTDDGGTTMWINIYPAMANVANSQGYNFSGGPNWTGFVLDWHWTEIMSEIDAGFPFVFSATAYPLHDGKTGGHSVGAVGYDDALGDVLVYTTWSTDDATPKHVHHGGNVDNLTAGTAPHPGGAGQYDVKLVSPDGFQGFGRCGSTGALVSGDTTTITWNNFGRPGDHVILYYSTDGGNSWPTIGTAPDNGSYTWNVPQISTTHGRIQIIQYSSSSSIASADGSYGDFTIAPIVVVTVGSDPAGVPMLVDGIEYTSTQTFRWIAGVDHRLSTSSQTLSEAKYDWLHWSDDGPIDHIVAPTSDTSYTASFSASYHLTMKDAPGITIFPYPGGFWGARGTVVRIQARPDSETVFTGWSGTGNGSYTGTDTVAYITMNGPITETATSLPPCMVTIATVPVGLNIDVDNRPYVAPRTFRWRNGATHSISLPTEQATGSDIYSWRKWSDGGAAGHSIAPTIDTTFTATFALRLQLTMVGSLGGTVMPASSLLDQGEVVQIGATPDSGYFFAGWTGSGNGSYTGPDNPAQVTMNTTISEHATFAPLPRVTFAVNMKAQFKDGSFRPDLGDILTVRGSFNDWGTSTNNRDTLKDADNDSIYTRQFSFSPATALEYKFWKTPRGGTMGWEEGIANRKLTVGFADTIPHTACFNGECLSVRVTFLVDMRTQRKDGTFRPDLGDVVTIRGSFNDWGNTTNNPDTLVGDAHDSVFVTTLSLAPHTLYDYKFWKTPRGGAMGYEEGIPNRQIDFGAQDVELPRVYFNNDLVPTLHLRVKAFLQGPYAGDHTMKRSLNTGGALAAHFGAGTFPGTAVDSITIEIRNAAVGKEATMRRWAPAWLLADGSIRAFTDTARTTVDWDSVSWGQYYIVLRHRNHLAAMSRIPYTCDGTIAPAPYDFTLSLEQYYTGDACLLVGGLYGLWSGDADGTGDVAASDRTATWNNRNQAGYMNADVDLTGDVGAVDRGVTWNNRNRASRVP
jgi:hypothetical protein